MHAANLLEGMATIQKHLGRLEGWAHRNRKKQNKDKCKVVHLEWMKLLHWSRLGTGWLWTTSVWKTLVDHKLKINTLWQ